MIEFNAHNKGVGYGAMLIIAHTHKRNAISCLMNRQKRPLFLSPVIFVGSEIR